MTRKRRPRPRFPTPSRHKPEQFCDVGRAFGPDSSCSAKINRHLTAHPPRSGIMPVKNKWLRQGSQFHQLSPEVWILHRLGGRPQRFADGLRKRFADSHLRGDVETRYHFDDQRAGRKSCRGSCVQKDISHQPQLVFPDRGVDQKHESVLIHVGQATLLGYRGGQILTQQLIEAAQHLGTLDQGPKPRRRSRLKGLRGRPRPSRDTILRVSTFNHDERYHRIQVFPGAKEVLAR